jgi:hypothetical protein
VGFNDFLEQQQLPKIRKYWYGTAADMNAETM